MASHPALSNPDGRAAEVDLAHRILRDLIGDRPLRQTRFLLWDGSYWPSDEPRAATIVLHHPGALRAMFEGASQVSMAEAFLFDDFDVEGDLSAGFELVDRIRDATAGWSKKLRIGARLKRLPSPAGPASEARRARLRGRSHSPERDRRAISFHYDLSNDFYRLWLDPRMVYSCAYFRPGVHTLEQAQEAKLEHICHKLDLRAGQTLLDIGCGWGGLLIHAARHYGVRATGITLSERQADFARARVEELGMGDRVEVQVRDYREVAGESCFDAVVSVGMVEHVGRKKLSAYYAQAHRLLKPGGVFLNHGITLGSVPNPNHNASFIGQYVFPDGELLPLRVVLDPVEAAGFEIRDVENLREHYARTLDHWVDRLERHHEEALAHVTEATYRIWRLYMAGSAHGFRSGHLAIYQTLLAKLDADGRARYPLTRDPWYR